MGCVEEKEDARAGDLVFMVERQAVVEVGATGADLLEGGVEDAELDDGGGRDGLIAGEVDGLVGGEVVGVEGDFAVEVFDLGLQLRGEGGVVLGVERRGSSQGYQEREEKASGVHGGNVALVRDGMVASAESAKFL